MSEVEGAAEGSPGEPGAPGAGGPTAEGDDATLPDKPVLEWTKEDWARWIEGPSVSGDVVADEPAIAAPADEETLSPPTQPRFPGSDPVGDEAVADDQEWMTPTLDTSAGPPAAAPVEDEVAPDALPGDDRREDDRGDPGAGPEPEGWAEATPPAAALAEPSESAVPEEVAPAEAFERSPDPLEGAAPADTVEQPLESSAPAVSPGSPPEPLESAAAADAFEQPLEAAAPADAFERSPEPLESAAAAEAFERSPEPLEAAAPADAFERSPEPLESAAPAVRAEPEPRPSESVPAVPAEPFRAAAPEEVASAELPEQYGNLSAPGVGAPEREASELPEQYEEALAAGTDGSALAPTAEDAWDDAPGATAVAAPVDAAEAEPYPWFAEEPEPAPATDDTEERRWWEPDPRPTPTAPPELEARRDAAAAEALAELSTAPVPSRPPVPVEGRPSTTRTPPRSAPATGSRTAPPRPQPVVVERSHRVRSAFGLLGVAVLVGTVVAGLITVAIFIISLALRRAVG